jgi:N-hydroxyarylamine O-acetyltransferase
VKQIVTVARHRIEHDRYRAARGEINRAQVRRRASLCTAAGGDGGVVSPRSTDRPEAGHDVVGVSRRARRVGARSLPENEAMNDATGPGVPGATSQGVDLDAYCARIGYRGPRTPTLATLSALQELHPAAIPFEAIDVMLGQPVDLAPAAVDAKLIGAKRGGYCFEHNGLFKRVLETIGFQVAGLLGRVYWMNASSNAVPARSHFALRVTIDGEDWLADVGFGSTVPTGPLRFNDPAPQPLRHDTFRVRTTVEGFAVEALIAGNWTLVYELSRDPPPEIDCIVANWYTSTHPDSGFRHHLILARTGLDAKYALRRNRLTIRPVDGPPQRIKLTAPQLRDTLRDAFLLEPQPEWEPIIAAMTADDSSS